MNIHNMINEIYEYGQGNRQALPEHEELAFLISELTEGAEQINTAAEYEFVYLQGLARENAVSNFGTDIYMRGLIEFTNFCKNDCYYCGIRRSNKNAERYRLTESDILGCCANGYSLGFRTFVLQGGEDGSYEAEAISELLRKIKEQYRDCAITLSFGEHSRDIYEKWFAAGADRYLLRHETAAKAHYERLHPAEMSYENRVRCLYDLKEIGYQVGSGFLVGSPYQTAFHLAEDLLFLDRLKPHMIGIGPFISHKDTPFKDEPSGTLKQTLVMISLLRLIFPKALIPATTALGTIAFDGREQGILSGANVVMPNLSPVSVRKKYMLYDNKICTGDEAAECRLCLEGRLRKIGYTLVSARGDYPGFTPPPDK